ncbi:hypothetical protein KCP73_02435 [Salmonella enterica subsp. enterica]|nr:hypothetical protein KCP73_02435 [Salmonella enterica subsp. enterica]
MLKENHRTRRKCEAEVTNRKGASPGGLLNGDGFSSVSFGLSSVIICYAVRLQRLQPPPAHRLPPCLPYWFSLRRRGKNQLCSRIRATAGFSFRQPR